MRFSERMIQTKDGRSCILCPTSPEYAEKMLEYLKLTAAESPFLLRYPDEISFTLEEEKQILSSILEDKNSIMMLALVDGEVAGNASINGLGSQRRIHHRCSIAIALKKAYWGLGIGTDMIKFLTELARQIGYEQIELEVANENETAKHLYEKSGFVATGRIIHALKYDDDSYSDVIIMSKLLNN